jgi:hypothetical protein
MANDFKRFDECIEAKKYTICTIKLDKTISEKERINKIAEYLRGIEDIERIKYAIGKRELRRQKLKELKTI